MASSSANPAGVTAIHRSKSLVEFIQLLDDKSVDTLYSSPAACLAVFRQLPCLAQAFIYRQLFSTDTARELGVIMQWTAPAAKFEVDQTCNLLRNLHIWKVESSSTAASSSTSLGSDVKIRLNNRFKEKLHQCIFGGSKALLEEVACSPEHRASSEFLTDTAQKRWDRILHFIISLTGENEKIPDVVREVLQTAELMRRDEKSRTLEITSDGFRFLLLDRPAQVWKIMNGYVNYLHQRKFDLAECLAFLFELSFTRIGQPYNKSTTSRLSQLHQKILLDLVAFGLVHMSSKDVDKFYCTGLITLIGQGGKMDAASAHALESAGISNTTEEGYLVVETNFRVYAYTESPLKIATLAFFCEMTYRFPQMAIGIITRESVREALLHGITADEIISFLETRAHPKLIESVAKHNENDLVLMPKPLLPASLTDQIRLWEMEVKRYSIEDATAYSGFSSEQDFELVKRFCEDQKLLIGANERNLVVVIKAKGHEAVKAFYKKNKKDKE